MDSGMLLGAIVGFLSLTLGIWGASLVVRALASRAARFSPRWRGRVPRPLHITPPRLSRVQFWFGMVAGSLFFVGGVMLSVVAMRELLVEREGPSPLFLIGAIGLAVLGLGTVLVGLGWDRAHGRRRCSACWYEYTGLSDSAACPECGKVPASPRALLRTRRSPLMLRLGASMLLGSVALYLAPEAIKSQGRSLMPTALLIATFERLPDHFVLAGSWADDRSLQARLWNDQVSLEQRAWLFARSARVLETSGDPDTCATAAVFLGLSTHIYGAPAPPEMLRDLDAANANVLRLLLGEQGAISPQLEQISLICTGPMTQRVVEDRIDVVLGRYEAATAALPMLAYGKLIVRLAPTTPEVVGVASAKAMDHTLGRGEQAVACVVYGMLARRDPTLRDQLDRDYASASGADREALATARLASEGEPGRIVAGGIWSSMEHPQTQAILDALHSKDGAMRHGAMAYLTVQVHLVGAAIDMAAVTASIRELAQKAPESRGRAIQFLSDRGDLTSDMVATLAAHAREGSGEDLVQLEISLRRAWMNTSWIPLYDAVVERQKDPGLDQGSLDALEQIRSRMKQSIPSLQ